MKQFLAVLLLAAVGAEARADIPGANHTATGTIVKLEPAEREIYVMSEGEKLEYYFNPKTAVTENNEPKRYEDLKQGQSVKVSSKKIGKRLDPIAVEILP